MKYISNLMDYQIIYVYIVYNMYTNITDPNTGGKYEIDSVRGKFLMSKYTQQIGGKFLGLGTYKCAFSPAIKCFNDVKRIGDADGDSVDNYVSLIVQYSEAVSEMKMNSLLKKFDPTQDFTIPIEKMCPIGDLDQKTEESLKEFIACKKSNFLGKYKYPYNSYPSGTKKLKNIQWNRKGWNNNDLFLLLVKKGGVDLHALPRPIDQITQLVLCIKFTQVIKGLLRMNQAGYTHADIKTRNVLYNDAEQKYYIIDFGQTAKSKTILHNNGLYGQDYFAWPRSVKVANLYSWHGGRALYAAGKDWRAETTALHGKYGHTMLSRLKFIAESGNKLDVYSLGVLMMDFIGTFRCERSPLWKTFGTRLTKLVRGANRSANKFMLSEDPYTRYSMAEVLHEYTLMVKPLIGRLRDVLLAQDNAKRAAPRQPPGCSRYKMRTDPKCKDQDGCVYKRGRGCISEAKPKPKAKPKAKLIVRIDPLVDVIHYKGSAQKESDCSQYRMRYAPKCKDQVGCVYKRGKGCIRKE